MPRTCWRGGGQLDPLCSELRTYVGAAMGAWWAPPRMFNVPCPRLPAAARQCAHPEGRGHVSTRTLVHKDPQQPRGATAHRHPCRRGSTKCSGHTTEPFAVRRHTHTRTGAHLENAKWKITRRRCHGPRGPTCMTCPSALPPARPSLGLGPPCILAVHTAWTAGHRPGPLEDPTPRPEG